MKFISVIQLTISLTFLSGLSTNAMELNVYGHTENLTPQITVVRLATPDDRVSATTGIDDLTTPLGLAGTIRYGFKDSEENTIGIAAADSMWTIFNNLKNFPSFPNTNIPTELTIIKSANLDIKFTLGPVLLNSAKKWILSMETNKPGNLLFFDTSNLTPLSNQVTFSNGNTLNITSTIFPNESTNTLGNVAAVYYLNGDADTPYYCNGNKLTFGDTFTLNFKKAEQ